MLKIVLCGMLFCATERVLPAAHKPTKNKLQREVGKSNRGYVAAKKKLDEALELGYSTSFKDKEKALKWLKESLNHAALREKINTVLCYREKDGFTGEFDKAVPLFSACEGLGAEGIEALVRAGASFWVQEKEAKTKMTPLHALGESCDLDASTCDIERIKVLIEKEMQEKKLSIDIKDDYGWTPLMVACQGGRAAVAQMFLELGADPNREADPCSSLGNTLLHDAILGYRTDVIQVLLESKKVQLDRGNTAGVTPAEFARRSESGSIKKLFKVVDAQSLQSNISRTIEDAKRLDTKLTKIITQHFAENNAVVNAYTNDVLKWTPLFEAVAESQYETVMDLLGKGADPRMRDATGQTPREMLQDIMNKRFDVVSDELREDLIKMQESMNRFDELIRSWNPEKLQEMNARHQSDQEKIYAALQKYAALHDMLEEDVDSDQSESASSSSSSLSD